MRIVFFAAASILSLVSCCSASAATFTQLDVFGDSTVDGGWWKGALAGQCGPVTGGGCATGDTTKDNKIQDAIAAGGTGAPVGVGAMNTAILASMLGLSANPANQAGGTNYAISGSLDAVAGGFGNLNLNSNLPSTVQQITNYLASNGGIASSTALYLISSGGNDITFANTPSNNLTTLAAKESFLSNQVAKLATAIGTLQSLGAQHFLVYNNYGTGFLSTYYNQQLATALAPYHVTIADIASMVQTVEANPTAYGFTAATVMRGIPGPNTGSACVAGSGASGWGQVCGNTTTPNSNFAHLRSADAEQTSFFSDDQHFSAAGQQIEADYVYGILQGVPEPSTWAMMVLGFAGLGLLAYRRRPRALSAA